MADACNEWMKFEKMCCALRFSAIAIGHDIDHCGGGVVSPFRTIIIASAIILNKEAK